ncbi:MAG: NAD(P)-dependent alcohol dehydrogenase [Deltaproteobacteria bacterium]|nr:NAD(P)-dependent alcohol dehydrogenase [Deltaproteobacteria bacterium]
MPVTAYAAFEKGHKLDTFSYDPKPLGAYDIEITISHCGVCHSDLHLIDNDWGFSKYPLVPGHEIIGKITLKGSSVSHLKIGDRVGVGWQRSSCLECEWCLKGDENLCSRQEATCVGHFGGFAKQVRVDSRFAFKIPENLDSEKASPLMCGGITVYSPLRVFGVNASHRVGVLGVGGLGHLAIQFAKAMGTEVTAFTTNPEKKEELKTLGANSVVITSDKHELRKCHQSLDIIISTVFVNLDFAKYLQYLRPNGKLVFVGVPSEPLQIPPVALLDGRKSISGSPIGGRALIQEMLTFSERHNISAMTEVFSLDDVNHAIEKVRKNQVRYRAVLVA